MADSPINKDVFEATIAKAYRELEDPISDLCDAGHLCGIALTRAHDEGFSCEPEEFETKKSEMTKRTFFVHEDDFSALTYAIRHVHDLIEELRASYSDGFHRSRKEAQEGANG